MIYIKSVMAIVLGVGMAFVFYLLNLLNSPIGDYNKVVEPITFMYSPGFFVGFIGLFFVWPALRHWYLAPLFVIIAGLSYYLGMLGSTGSVESIGNYGGVFGTFIIIGTLINVLQFFILEKTSISWKIAIVWLFYSLVALPIFATTLVNRNSDGDMILLSNIFMMESLWQVGFYLMLVFYTSRSTETYWKAFKFPKTILSK